MIIMAARSVCLVTGGASGLGRATVLRFVKRGANVILADLPSSDGENVAKEMGANVVFHPADVRTEDVFSWHGLNNAVAVVAC